MLVLQSHQGILGQVVEVVCSNSCSGAAMERTGLGGLWVFSLVFFFFFEEMNNTGFSSILSVLASRFS